MIYLIICNTITHEVFTDSQDAKDRVKHLNSKLNIIERMCGYRWAVKEMLLQ